MIKIIQYFIDNARLNYAMLFFLLYMGINAYLNIPKELFPVTELDKISIQGSYPGASADNMDKMAVRELEDGISNISGIDKSETTIAPGYFSMILTLNENANKVSILNNVKDAIALSKQYLPSDMNEPTAVILDRSRALVKLSVSSKELSRGELTEVAKEIKN
jgi:hydrophobic/amphiphilic exporter-1 (mainly G- bacteria), HAE1 family